MLLRITMTMLIWVPTTLCQETEFPVGVFLFGDTLVDHVQMKSDLGLTWIQGYGGTGNFHSGLERNRVGLRVISARHSLVDLSRAQRLVYEAEASWPQRPLEDNWIYAFFGKKETGRSVEGAHYCDPSSDRPGFMVRQPRPDNKFHKSVTEYFVTVRLRIEKGTDRDAPVATISAACYHHEGKVLAQRTLYDRDFGDSDSYQEFEVPFATNFAIVTTPENTSKRVPLSPACDSVDIRIHWTGNVRTWLDRVIIEDRKGKALFAGNHDAVIEAEAKSYVDDSSLDQVMFFYLADEPDVQFFLPFSYIDNKLRSIPKGSRRGAITAVNWKDNWLRWFLYSGKPQVLLLDGYVLNSSLPSPSMDQTISNSLGVAPFRDNESYNKALNDRLHLLIEKLYDSARFTREIGIPFWYVPQLHGEYIVSTGKFVKQDGRPALRPPTGAEIMVQCNTAIAFGARGLIAYTYGTDHLSSFEGREAFILGLVTGNADSDGRHRNHSSNFVDLPSGNQRVTKQVFGGYQEKWEAFKNTATQLRALAPVLLTLSWQGTKSWFEEPAREYLPAGRDWSKLIEVVQTKSRRGRPDTDLSVITTHFSDENGTNYFWVVNSRCGPEDDRLIGLQFHFEERILVEEVPDGEKWDVEGDETVEINVPPGGGRLLIIRTQ